MPPETREVIAGEAEKDERLDRLLAARLAEFSRSRLKHLVETGHVRLNGATITDPSMRVKPGQAFTVALPPPVEDRPLPQKIALTIVFEDAHLIVIDKPAGLVVHPAPGNPDNTLVNALLAHCGDSLAGIGGVRRPGIVHRLDKDTSGLMVVAKTEPAHRALAQAFASRDIIRSYQALVWGLPEPPSGEITGAIGRSPRDRKKMAVVARGGREAVTRYRVLRGFGLVASLLECRLGTGRTHQIRVHLSAKGHPLIGDQTYTGRVARTRLAALPVPLQRSIGAFPRQALHADRLGFRHPASRELLEFVSVLPSDMRTLVDSLERL